MFLARVTGHVVATQQNLHYNFAGLPLNVSEELMNNFTAKTRRTLRCAENDSG